MSEPPLKKKRTILDFFDKTDTKARGPVKKAKTMASTESTDTDTVSPTLQIQDNAEEKPGPSKDVTDDCTVVSGDSEETDDSQGLVQDVPTKKPSQKQQGSDAWKGIPLKVMNKVSSDTDGLQLTPHHRILFKLPYKYSDTKPPQPFPQYKDRWDNNHVRMPCSPQNEYPTQGKHGKPEVGRRWDMIQEVLLGPIPGPYELEEKILSYNSRYIGKWSFDVVHHFFIEHCAQEERDQFFNHTLKKIAHLALQLPHLCSAPIPLLKAGNNFSITLSQQQIACLLANAFFCTFPRRNAKSKNSEYFYYPSINFNSLFTGHPSKVRLEKLRCIINYFRRVCDKMPTGTVTFTRKCLTRFPAWDKDTALIKALHVSSEGTIEDDGEGFLQVDFANMYLGGGVLGHGCVQEEIRFLICPEMIVSRLFTECLDKNECLIMKGCERFSNYDGYASKFEWKDNYVDKTERDSAGRIKCEVVAIDALVVRDYRAQFQPGLIARELNKAYVGFYSDSSTPLPAVCTGNWGCGAFGGDKQLKALIQLMAASRAGRDLCYFTFDDDNLRDDLYSIHKLITDKNLHIGDVMYLIENYYKDQVSYLYFFTIKPSEPLYTYLDKALQKYQPSFNATLNRGPHPVESSYRPSVPQYSARDNFQPNMSVTQQRSMSNPAARPKTATFGSHGVVGSGADLSAGMQKLSLNGQGNMIGSGSNGNAVSCNQDNSDQVSGRKDDHVDQVSGRKDDHADQVSGRKDDHPDQVSGRKDDHPDQVSGRKDDHPDQVSGRKDDHTDQMSGRKDGNLSPACRRDGSNFLHSNTASHQESVHSHVKATNTGVQNAPIINRLIHEKGASGVNKGKYNSISDTVVSALTNDYNTANRNVFVNSHRSYADAARMKVTFEHPGVHRVYSAGRNVHSTHGDDNRKSRVQDKSWTNSHRR